MRQKYPDLTDAECLAVNFVVLTAAGPETGGLVGRLELKGTCVDMLELGIAVRVAASLIGLGIG